ncbi:hypothetical protein BDD12DRAFT_895628 [Trichophaea hybrida]|nr:hypothetical protein BDD12DRAFT_895628 [Trichophaea hybrida]
MTREDYLGSLKNQFDNTVSMMANLFKQNDQLEKDLENSQLDYTSSMDANRQHQRRIRELEKKMEEQDRALNINNYVLVLVDGDGMIFRNDLIKEGKAGGKEAADRLYKQVSERTKLKPIIRVFASVERLAKTFTEGGLIKTSSVFRQFTVGFSDPCHEHVDFVDVGEGKEMADEKLKSELKWHLKNYNCSSIILGASHDNGYARVLNAVTCEHEEALRKIQLLEGPPFGRELENLSFKRVEFTDVFSSEKFDAFRPLQKVPAPVPAAATGPPPGLPSPITPHARIASQPSNPSPPGSYAAAVVTVSTYSPPPSIGHDSPKPAKATTAITEESFKAALRKVKQLYPKPCNNHYLKGDCLYTNLECKFGHDYDLSASDIQAMRRLAATKQCNWGRECINERCYYSHEWDEAPGEY